MNKFILLTLVCISSLSLNGQTWIETQKLISPDRSENDIFGAKVSISGNYALVGAPFEDTDVNGANPIFGAGAAYIFQKDGMGNWQYIQKIVASDRGSNDYFGNSAEISGDYMIVGARLNDNDAQGGNFLESAGAAYIFERNQNGIWLQVQKIVAMDRGEGDNFGAAVAIYQDYAIVGAFNDNKDATGANPLNFAGSAYFFERNPSGVWQQVEKVVPSDRAVFDWFGISVDISNDYAVIGASQSNTGVNGSGFVPQAGSAYIFERGPMGGWTEAQKVIASDRSGFSTFGIAVAIDSNIALVGAHQEDFNANGTDSLKDAGAIYVFERDLVGEWQETQKLVPSDRGFEDNFGSTMAIDGGWIVAGVLKEDEDTLGMNTLDEAGSVYLFARDSLTNQWQETQKIVSSQRHTQAHFGNALDIEDTLIMVGANFDDYDLNGGSLLNKAGAVYVFQLPVEKDTTNSTSITENSLQNTLKVYPNPSVGLLTIDLAQYYPEVNIRLRNTLGQLVFQKTLQQTREVKLEINPTSDMYLLEVITPAEKAVFKVIIAR